MYAGGGYDPEVGPVFRLKEMMVITRCKSWDDRKWMDGGGRGWNIPGRWREYLIVFIYEALSFSLSISTILHWVFHLMDTWSPLLYFKCLRNKDAAISLGFEKFLEGAGTIKKNRCWVGVGGVSERSAGGGLI